MVQSVEISHLVGEGVHDDVVGHEAERVNLLHEDVGRDHVEVDELEEGSEGVGDVAIGRVTVLLAPHERRLELGELVGPELLPGEDKPHHVLGQEGEGPEIEYLIRQIGSNLVRSLLSDLLNSRLLTSAGSSE